MNGRLISLIYFYAVSAAALALIVIGIFSSINFLINISQYQDYPLRYQGEDCDNIYPMSLKVPAPILAPNNSAPATPSTQQIEKQRQACQNRIDRYRKGQKLEDLKKSITFSLVGTILFLIHFPVARRQSKSS